MNYNLLKKLTESSDKNLIISTKLGKKSLYSLLLNIKGLNKSSILKIFSILGFNYKTRINDLSKDDYKNIDSILVEYFLVNDDVSKFINEMKRRYIDIKHYKGLRYRYGFPVNGQRTSSNSKTSKKFSFR